MINSTYPQRFPAIVEKSVGVMAGKAAGEPTRAIPCQGLQTLWGSGISCMR